MNKAAFEARVMEILRENAASKWRRHREDGHLDPRSLHEFRVSPEIWRLKEIAGSRKYFASFVLDMSGSMDGAKADAAKSMAIQFADSMAVLGIPFSIWAFGTFPVKVHSAGDYYSRPRLRARMNAIYDGIGYCADPANGYRLSIDGAYGDDAEIRSNYSTYGKELLDRVVSDRHAANIPTVPNGAGRCHLKGGTNPGMVLGLAMKEAAESGAEPIVVFMSDGDIGHTNHMGYGSDSSWSRRVVAPILNLYAEHWDSFKAHLESLGFERYMGAGREPHYRDGKIRPVFLLTDWRNSTGSGRFKGPCGFVAKSMAGDADWDSFADINAAFTHYVVKEKLKGSFLFMGVQDASLERFSQIGLVPESDTFSVYNLAQGYDAIVSKLARNFSFDHAKKLR